MKMRNTFWRSALVLILALALAAFAGCGQTGSGEGGDDPAPDSNAPVHVDSVEALIEAIKPGAEIVIEPGKYNLTHFLNDFSDAKDRDEWNQSHDYARIDEVFDGQELCIVNVKGLKISGGDDDRANTELVTEPRYADLFEFRHCENIELENLTMGHTDTGECVGNVLDFATCTDVNLRNMDLSGCGVFGIGCTDGTGNVYVFDSTIRDCSYGTLAVDEPDGEFVFTDCKFTGSDWGGYFNYTDNSDLTFKGCTFGDNETNCWYFDERAKFEDCTWAEVTEYPDYSEYDYDVEPDDDGGQG